MTKAKKRKPRARAPGLVLDCKSAAIRVCCLRHATEVQEPKGRVESLTAQVRRLQGLMGAEAQQAQAAQQEAAKVKSDLEATQALCGRHSARIADLAAALGQAIGVLKRLGQAPLTLDPQDSAKCVAECYKVLVGR